MKNFPINHSIEAKLLSFEIYNNQDNLVIKHTDLDKILAKAKKKINNI